MPILGFVVALRLVAAAAAFVIAVPALAAAQLPVTQPAPVQQVQPPRADTTTPPLAVVPATDSAREVEAGAMGGADRAMGAVNAVVGYFLFFDVLFWDDDHTVPFIVLWLVVAAVFLTFRMGFINIRAFGHAVDVTRGKYTPPGVAGDVSHFQALSTALSATVGLGNIAGVAIAISLGGPGATLWMIVAGLLGMTTKFTECTLGQMYREVRPDGRILGGPMQYLSKGMAELGKPGFGKALAVLFAILCIGGSLGGGNSFQVNQSLNAMQETFPILASTPWAYGLLMTFLVAIVIVGGIRRIAHVAEGIVPIMCGVYLVGALVVIFMNVDAVPAALGAIVTQAFAPDALYGGIIGALVVGFQRAAFSNEAGAGSAAIAHSAAKSEYPVREGIVALLEPFIDTVVVCTITALVVVITGAYNNPEYADLIAGSKGAALTSRAFSEEIRWFPYVISAVVFMFAYSTMISWSYYGERCAVWLFGEGASGYFKALFLLFVFLGSVITSANVLNFGDLMILGMAFPNLIGVYFLHGRVRRAIAEYWARYRAGGMPVYK
ncbi:MAG TPA: alanine/glycine:cation symporter family protein [Gemmatimonadaceae bacterium]|nr:alanine/glycine:cation symporter family protein [Gemmatimonadaceae bacterium]